jgi:hypothetical protein
MAVVMLVDNPQGSQDVYDKVRAHLGIDRPAGGIFHVAGPSPTGGFRVIELWDSEEDARRFLRDRFAPALQAIGESGPIPRIEFWPVYHTMTPDQPQRAVR